MAQKVSRFWIIWGCLVGNILNDHRIETDINIFYVCVFLKWRKLRYTLVFITWNGFNVAQCGYDLCTYNLQNIHHQQQNTKKEFEIIIIIIIKWRPWVIISLWLVQHCYNCSVLYLWYRFLSNTPQLGKLLRSSFHRASDYLVSPSWVIQLHFPQISQILNDGICVK